MPTIRKWFLLKFLAACLVVTGLLVGVHTVQAHRIPAALKRQAENAAADDKPDRAVHYLRHYLEFAPSDTEARVQMAELLKARPGRNPFDQLLLYEQILRADPTREAIRREALELAQRVGRSQDAATHAEELLKTSPDDAELRMKLATALAALQRTDEAVAQYEAALRAKPDDVELYQRYAFFLMNDAKRPQAAREVIRRLIDAAPKSARAWLTRAKFTQLPGQTDSKTPALADIRKALELDQTDADAWLMLSDQEQKLRRANEARDALTAGLKHHPHDVRLIRALAWLDLNLGNIGAAVTTLEQGLKHGDSGFELLGPLGDLLVQLGETGRAEAIVRELLAKPRPGTPMQVKYLNARLAMRGGKWADAIGMLTSLRNEAVALPSLENQCNMLLAACLQKRGRTAEEQETLKLLLNKDPNNLAARVALGQSYLNLGRAREATVEYALAVQSPYAGPSIHAVLIRLKLCDLANSATPRTAEWAVVDRVIGELVKVYGQNSSEATILRAESLEARGDLKQAVSLLRAETSRRPGDVKLWAALAERAARLAGSAVGLSLLDEAQAAAGDQSELRLARAGVIAGDPMRTDTAALDRLLEQVASWPDQERTRLYFGMVEIHDRLGHDDGVVRCYRLLCAERPADATFHEALSARLLRAGRIDEARAAQAVAAKLDPTGHSDPLFAARLASHQRDKPATVAAAARLRQLFGDEPDRADVCLVLADAAMQQGDAGTRGRMVERAVRLEPGRFPPMIAYLAWLAGKLSDEGVKALLLRLNADPRWHGEPMARVVVAAGKLGVKAGNERLREVLFACFRIVIERETYAAAQLADVAHSLGMPQEAQSWAMRAAQSSNARSDDFLRLIQRHGADAEMTLAAARKALPPTLYLQTAATCVEASNGRVTHAAELKTAGERRQWLQHRLNYRLAQYDRDGAVRLLEAALAEKSNDGDAAWAQRNMAMLLAVRGQAGDRKRAVELLAGSTANLGESAEEKRATAAVLTTLARHMDGAERKQAQDRAVAALEALAVQTRSPRDRFLLAQVYRSLGNRKAVVETVNALLAEDPKNLDYLLMGLAETVDLGTPEAAKPFADRLSALYGADYRALSAVARWEVACGRAEKAFEIAENYTRTADAAIGDLTAKSARSAELMDELVRLPQVRGTEIGKRMIQAAVGRYEALIPLRPEAVVAAAGLLALDARHAEAIALIQKHSGKLSPSLIAAAGLAVLRPGAASDRQFAEVQTWLAEARKADPNSTTAWLNEGEFAVLKQDFIAAEKAYRTVLAAEPRNTIALNNLAWILAPKPEAAAQALELIDRAAAEIGLTPDLLDTRARIRISAKQFDLAENDLREALTQQKTPLRMFHMALAKEGRTPADEEARRSFRQAKEKGLEPRSVHPADLPSYRRLEADRQRGPS